MELDANAVKTKQAAPIVNSKKEHTPTKSVIIQSIFFKQNQNHITLILYFNFNV